MGRRIWGSPRSAATHLAALALAVGLALASPGLSGRSHAADAPPLTAVTTAVEQTLATGYAKLAMRFSDSTPFGSPGHAVSATGAYDFGFAEGSLQLPKEAVKELVFAGSQLYVRHPASATVDPTQKPWTYVDLGNLEVKESKVSELVIQTESLNPLLALQQLSWGGVKATRTNAAKGPARYTVTVDLQQAAAQASGPAKLPFVAALQAQLTHGKRIRVAVERRQLGADLAGAVHASGCGCGHRHPGAVEVRGAHADQRARTRTGDRSPLGAGERGTRGQRRGRHRRLISAGPSRHGTRGARPQAPRPRPHRAPHRGSAARARAVVHRDRRCR